MFIKSILIFIGGIALFIYGTSIMSDNLKKASGNRFKKIIDKAVTNPFLAVLIGILITTITGSSSAVIILIIGLVRANLINVKQSVGLIIGANIGTTFSAIVISLPISQYAYLILFIGVILMFFKNKKINNTSGILIGISLLFIGLNVMGEGIAPIIDKGFETSLFNESILGRFSGFLFGTLFTSIIQSSSATTAIVQKLYSLNDPLNNIYTLSLKSALPIILGANLGTTVTGLLASIGGNEDSKRVALIHVLFNLVGSILFLTILTPYTYVVQSIENIFLSPYSMATIAFGHLIENVVTGIIMFIFINLVVKIVEKIIPKKTEDEIIIFDEKLIEQSPVIALEVVNQAINKLLDITVEYFYLTKEYSFKKNSKTVEEANLYETSIDELNGKINNYLLKIIRKGIRNQDLDSLSIYLDITKDLERIGDHLTNIVEFFEIRYNSNHDLCEFGISDLKLLYENLEKMFEDVKQSIKTDFNHHPTLTLELEEKVDELEELARKNYLDRLKKGLFDFYDTSNYTDILSDLERIGDHLHNISYTILDPLINSPLKTGLKTIKREVWKWT